MTRNPDMSIYVYSELLLTATVYIIGSQRNQSRIVSEAACIVVLGSFNHHE